MNNYKCCCENNDNDQTMLAEMESFIEQKLDDDLVFIVAFGRNGKVLPLRANKVTSRKIDFNQESIKTSKITNIKSGTLVSYVGSDVCYWGFDGVGEEFVHPH